VRQIDASDGKLIGHGTGEVEIEEGVLVLRRLHVRYELRVAPDADRAALERAFQRHMPKCPIYRSLNRAIDITTSLELRDS